MGFFDSIKKAFDTGGIGVKLDAPKEFRWADGALPVTVTLTGHKTEPRTVASLDFEFDDDVDRDSREMRTAGSQRDRSGSTVKLRWSHPGPIELAPTQVVSIDIRVPLTLEGAGDEPTGWLASALSAVATLGDITTRIPWYRLSVQVQVKVVGVNASKGASKRIRNSGELKIGSSGINLSAG